MLKAVVTRPDKDCGMQLLRMRSDTYHQNCDAYMNILNINKKIFLLLFTFKRGKKWNTHATDTTHIFFFIHTKDKKKTKKRFKYDTFPPPRVTSPRETQVVNKW
jgi:hypothetical protein